MRTRRLLPFVALIVFCAVGNAVAQEQVPLKEGGTIWGILVESQGCTQAQAAVLWPLVAQDSDLDPQADRTLPVGTPIYIQRDCNGRIVGASDTAGFRSQIESLRQEVATLTAQRDEMAGELEKKSVPSASATPSDEVVNLKAKLELAKLNLSERPSRTPRQAYIEAGFFGGSIGLGAGVVGLIGFVVMSRRRRVAIAIAPATQPQEENDFPRTVPVEHNGKDVVFTRKEDPGSSKVWYECPLDPSHKVATAKRCHFHLRLEHLGQEGQAFEEARVAS